MNDIENDEQFLSGGGEMGKLIRSMDWSKTALGPASEWPQSLRTSVSLCLSSTFPILIAWGPELIQIYNDSYRPICGAKHPGSMGQNFKICWETALPVVGDAFDRGLGGEGTYIKDQQMLLDRFGYIEEAFMTFSFAPIRDESGEVGGIFHPITETTDQILSARRTQVLRDLAMQTANAKTLDELYEMLTNVLPGFTYDVPFVQIYELKEDEDCAWLRTSTGIENSYSDFEKIKLYDDASIYGSLHIDQETEWPIQISDLSQRFGNYKSGPFENAPETALIFPVIHAGQEKPSGLLVCGVSSARSLDQEYKNFFELFANTVSTSFSNVYAYQQQQKRAQELAEIDQAKTAFFSNVSHEFRTPLTLILGPLQQLADQPELGGTLSVANRESMHRNAQRLLKLVNNLLDFSRMEAGRVKAAYEHVQIGALTADLASNFRSVIESADMDLDIDIAEPTSPVYLDTDMWEKIVLNLLSNAFKYTLKGTIRVEVKQEGEFAILQVSDTGIGIPESELPHMFERFHRVENALGRTHEGTGIGLSLVSELVNLHKGAITVTSVFGEGSTFSIHIPTGKNHLAPDQIFETANINKDSSLGETFVREAMSLLGNSSTEEFADASTDTTIPIGIAEASEINGHVLIVDDNADMRDYMIKLLSPHFSIDVAVNGQDALSKVAERIPDTVVSDVMMPVMDGRAFLSHLRAMPGKRVPVVLLSARAGEESKVEGLQWGADDYLVKPFLAKELISKVSSLVKNNLLAQKTEAELRNIFFQSPVAIGIFRGEQLIIEVANAIMLRYWGKSSNEVIGKPFAAVFDQTLNDGLDTIAREVFQTGKRRTLHEWPIDIIRHGKPAKLYISLVMQPLLDSAGTINGVIVVAHDVTELVTALDLVKESEQRFKHLADSTPQFIWRVDKTGGSNFYNDYTLKYTGLTHDKLIETGLIAAVVHPDEQEDNLSVWKKSMETGEDFSYEHRYRRYDGEYRWHLSRGIALHGKSGTIETWIGSSTDIHDQKTLEEKLEGYVLSRTAELENMNDRLVQKNQELEQFAHVTSHDLQEPLRKIQVFSKMVQAKIPEDDAATNKYLTRIIASSERMSLLIRDLLNYASISDTAQSFEEVDLNRVLQQVTIDYELLIAQKNAEIIYENLPVIRAIPLQMNQLFTNLLSNSLKFSRDPVKIEVSCKILNESESGLYEYLQPAKTYALITFKDNGLGFDQQFADRMFTIFQRLHQQKDVAGTGIGLSICKRIVHNHSGVILAEGVKDVGATFQIFLPYEMQDAG